MDEVSVEKGVTGRGFRGPWRASVSVERYVKLGKSICRIHCRVARSIRRYRHLDEELEVSVCSVTVVESVQLRDEGARLSCRFFWKRRHTALAVQGCSCRSGFPGRPRPMDACPGIIIIGVLSSPITFEGRCHRRPRAPGRKAVPSAGDVQSNPGQPSTCQSLDETHHNKVPSGSFTSKDTSYNLSA